MSSSASLVAALANIRAQAQELSGLIQANQKAKLRNWEQEVGGSRGFKGEGLQHTLGRRWRVTGEEVGGNRAFMAGERGGAITTFITIGSSIPTAIAIVIKTWHMPPSAMGNLCQWSTKGREVKGREREQKQQLISSLTQSQDILRKEKARVRAELKAQLARQAPPPKTPANSSSWEAAGDVVDLQTKLIDLNNRLLDIDLGLKSVVAELQTCRQQDTEVLSTKLVDTKRILQGEIDGLRANIFQIESIARREEDRKTFSTGGSGVYIAARDLFLSEVSGRFELSCEQFTRPDGSLAARLTVLLAGVSASSEWAEQPRQQRPEPGGGGGRAPGSPSGAGGSSRALPGHKEGAAQKGEMDSVRGEAVQERVGRMREGVRDISLEGVKEAVGGRVDRMKGGLQEGVQVGRAAGAGWLDA
ncbi:hypothetical protein QJQ45_029476 [Haematococcus lacustris]|nr:hypothetical protein QJQ45_029476 [Haematococcus lacustris]